MIKLRRLAFLALLSVFLSVPGCSWFSKHPVIPAVVTCSGKTIPLATVEQVYTDVMTENWVDLVANVVPLLQGGYADVMCIWHYLSTSNPETVPHIQALKAKHAADLRGSVSDSTETKDRPARPGAAETAGGTPPAGARERGMSRPAAISPREQELADADARCGVKRGLPVGDRVLCWRPTWRMWVAAN